MVDRYQVGDSFTETEVAAVHSMTIIDVTDEHYLMAEEWVNVEGKHVWVEYEAPHAGLENRADQGKCEPAGSVSENPFETVMKHTEIARQRS